MEYLSLRVMIRCGVFLFIINIQQFKIQQKINKYKFNKERIKLMYFNSAARSSIDYRYRQPTALFQLDDLIYRYPRTSYMPRRRTQYQDPDYLIESQHLYRERNQLYSQLKQQKLSNQRSRLILQDLLADTKKKKTYNQDDAIRNKIKTKDNSRPNSHDGLHKSDYIFKEENSNKKPGVTSHDYSHYKSPSNLSGKKTINVELKNQSSSGKKRNQEELQNQTNQSNHMKEVIFKKLYEDHKKSKIKQKQSPAAQKQSPLKQKNIYNDQQILKEEITFLKEQLQQKNKIIVDLQCELVKRSKVDSILSGLLSKQRKQGEQEDMPVTDTQQAGIQTQQQNVQSEQKHAKVKRPALRIQNNNIDLLIPPIKFLLKQKTLQKSNLLWMSIDRLQERETKDEFMETNATLPRYDASIIHQEKLEESGPLENVQNTESKIEPMSLIVHAQTQTQNDKPNNHKQLEETLKLSFQTQSLPIRMNSQDVITQSISMRIDSEESEMMDLTLSASQAQPSPQIKKKQSASKVMNAIREQQSLILSYEHQIQDSCQTETKQTNNQQSQTSQNVYDHIEQTYLEWVFDKDFKEMENRKKLKSQPDEAKQQK